MNIDNIIQHYDKNNKKDILKFYNDLNEIDIKDNIKNFGFLNKNMLAILEDLSIHFENIDILYDGGYSDAEKIKVIAFPKYFNITDIGISYLNINYVNKYDKITHSQILGTLYNAGIDMSKVGDIIVSSDGKAQIVVDKDLASVIPYLINNIAKFSVEIKEIEEISITPLIRELKRVKVSSLRLDTILKNIFKMSRNDAKKYILGKKVTLNYDVATNVNKNISENDIITLRKYGIIKVEKVDEQKNGYYIEYR